MFEKKSGIAKLKQENRKITFSNAQGVFQLDFNEEANASFMEYSTLRMVVLKQEKAANELNLQQLSIQAGMNWVLCYLLKIKDEKTARLEMRQYFKIASNTLRIRKPNLVVGVPQMYFGIRRDPITYDYLTTDRSTHQENAQPSQMLSNAGFGRSAKAAEMDESVAMCYLNRMEENQHKQEWAMITT